MIKEFKLSQVQEIHPKIYTIVGVIYQYICPSLRCFMDMNSKSSFSKRNIVTEVGLQGFNVNGSQSLDVLGVRNQSHLLQKISTFLNIIYCFIHEV